MQYAIRINSRISDVESIIQRLAQRVQQESISEGSHDWWHVWRVWQLARQLGQAEGADLELVELAALCHDLEDWKYAHAPRIEPILSELGLPREQIEKVLDICQRISFKGAGVADQMPTLEGQVVQDADRLDAIGAIGIARCFAFGGARSRALYDPADPPELHQTAQAYQSKSGSSQPLLRKTVFAQRPHAHPIGQSPGRATPRLYGRIRSAIFGRVAGPWLVQRGMIVARPLQHEA